MLSSDTMHRDKEEILFDSLLKYHIGELGRYQWLVVFIVGYGWIFSAFQVMSPVFVSATPKYSCAHAPEVQAYFNRSVHCPQFPHGGNGSTAEAALGKCDTLSGNWSAITDDVTDTCALTGDVNNTSVVPCSSWSYDTNEYSSTIVTEWNLVCGQKWKASTVASAFMAGFTLGNVVFGFLADRFGRRKVCLFSGLANVAVTAVSAFSSSYALFITMRFLQAFLYTGRMNASFVIGVEFCGPSRRVFVGSLLGAFWAVGYILLAGIGYVIRDWKTLTLVLSLTELSYYVLHFFLIPESPRWLYLRGRDAEATKVMKKMAKFNRTTMPTNITVKTEIEDDTKTYLDLFKTPMVRTVSLVMLFNWAVNGFVYYGLSLNTSNLGGNPYVNFLISGAVELPAYAFIWFSFNTLGRLVPYAASLFLGGLANLLILAIPQENDVAIITVSMFGKFFVSVSFLMAWVYSCEVYPTCIRNLGLQVIGVSARLASIIAPFVGLLAAYGPAFPPAIFGVLSLTAGVLMILLPETKDRPMAQSIKEGELMIRQNRIRICRRRPKDRHIGKVTEELRDQHVSLV